MKPRAAVIGVLASLGILAVGAEVGAIGHQASTSTTSATSGDLTDGTYTGTIESTRFGDVEVSATVSGGNLTEVTALELTDAEPRSVSISNYAAPLLRSEALKAQSAQVSTISGATYTSEAYLSSLQSALDQAAKS